MGIVNRTPDSFFDGGVYVGDGAARKHVEQLMLDGVDIIDVGAESSRPGAAVVSAGEQIDRLGDIIPFMKSRGAYVSIDTTSAEVASHAVRQGARMINSIALEPTRDLAAIAAAHDAELVLTHCRAATNDMADFSVYADDAYDNVVDEVADEWLEAAGVARAQGVPAERIICDPGLGFTKNAAQSLIVATHLAELKQQVAPHRVLVGTSRKSYVASAVAEQLGGAPPAPKDRLGGSVAAALDCAAQGVDIVRVHDVAVVRQALTYARAASGVAGGRSAGGAQCSRA